jgi:transcription initiation factor TFIIIB Brf1 subunit/transcription initiation factor TFIIB
MKCSECNSITTTFDERMGETICSDCGLILSINVFEETSVSVRSSNTGNAFGNPFSKTRDADFNGLGSIIGRQDITNRKTFSLFEEQKRTDYDSSTYNFRLSASIFLSYYNGKNLLAEATRKYKTMKEEHLVRGLPIENVAAGIVYYVLKDKGISVSLKEFSRQSKIPIKNIVRTSKRAKKKFGCTDFNFINIDNIITETIERIRVRQQETITRYNKTHKNSPQGYKTYRNNRTSFEDIQGDLRQDCYRFAEYVKRCYDLFDETLTKSDIIASMWVVSQIYNSQSITTAALSECGGFSEVTLRDKRKRICSNLKLDIDKIKLYTINNIIDGVR